jgi:hypothetical protein
MVVPRMVRPLLSAINQRDDEYYSKKQFGLSTTMRKQTNPFFDYTSFDMLSLSITMRKQTNPFFDYTSFDMLSRK